MSRAEQILDIMRTEPGRTWTSAEISTRLGCAPIQANNAMRRMLKTSELVRVDTGAYSLVSRFERPATEPEPVAPAPPAQDEITAAERDTFISALVSFGYPVPGSALVGRLRRTLPDFDLSRLGIVAAELRKRAEIVRHSDGKYALPTWKGGSQ